MSDALAGLDDVPWGRLHHAYGNAGDVPGLLRAMTDPAMAVTAVHQLDTAIYHQGGAVCSAGAAAVPFLIRLACDRQTPHRRGVVDLLASFAQLVNQIVEPWASRDEAVTCRRNLAAGTDDLVALMEDEDSRMRRAAVDLVAALNEAADRVVDLLIAREAREGDLDVRVALTLAVGDMVQRGVLPPATRDRVAAWLDDQGHGPGDPQYLATLVARHRLSTGSVSGEAFVSALADAALMPEAYPPGATSAAGLALWVGREIGADREARTSLARWVLSSRRPVSAAGLPEVGAVMMRWRSATRALVPHVATLLADAAPELRAGAAHLVAASGELSRPYADRLAELAAGRSGRAAAGAVWALARLGDRRAVPYLDATLRRDPELFDVSRDFYSDGSYWLEQMPGLGDVLAPMAPHAEALMNAIRWRLRHIESLPVIHTLSEVLTGYGSSAAAATPQLMSLLRGETTAPACDALGAIGPPAARAVRRLHQIARGDDGGRNNPAQAASWALFRITGDPQPLLARLDLSAGYQLRHQIARYLADLGPVAAARADQVAEILHSDPDWWTNWQGVELARAHWRLTGDPDLCLRVFDAALAPLRQRRLPPVIRRVLRCLPEFGAAATRYAPLLEQVIDADERLVNCGGWRAIAEDDEARTLAAQVLRHLHDGYTASARP